MQETIHRPQVTVLNESPFRRLLNNPLQCKVKYKDKNPQAGLGANRDDGKYP